MTPAERKQFAEDHVEYEVRMLREQTDALTKLAHKQRLRRGRTGPGDPFLGADGQALIEATLMHLRLLDAALGATREMWVTTECSGCGKKQRVEVKIPDVRSRVAAIELLLREGLGRPPQAEDATSPRLPRTAEALAKLSWEDMKMIFATHFASEIAAVTTDGDALLRERVGALDEDQRQLLRDALSG
jgi:hypothetical protein